MKLPGFTGEALRRLMATRSVLLPMLQGANAGQQLTTWIKRGGSAEVIQFDEFRERAAEVIQFDNFRTDPERDVGWERRYFAVTT
jgi:hypothetical protein